MLYTQEELPETLYKSLLAEPHARKIFMRSYDEVWQKFGESPKYSNYKKRNEFATGEAWRTVLQAYGLVT